MEEVARVDEISDQRRINPARGRWYWLVAGGVAAVALFSLLQAGLRRIMPETYVQVRGYAEGRNSLVGPYDMLVVGDSIAAGGRWATLFAGQTVGNYGRNGDKTTDLLGRLPAFRDTSAGRIYILIGTNDVLQGRPTAQIVDDYRAVVRALHRDGREIMLNSILPPESALLRQHWGIVFDGRALRELNNELKRMAVGEGARYVDLINALAPAGQLSPEMTSDGVHLTPRGYAAIAGVWSALTVEGAR